MTKKQIEITALFFMSRHDGMPHLEELLKLDDFWAQIYEVNKRRSFEEGRMIANECVINEILKTIS